MDTRPNFPTHPYNFRNAVDRDSQSDGAAPDSDLRPRSSSQGVGLFVVVFIYEMSSWPRGSVSKSALGVATVGVIGHEVGEGPKKRSAKSPRSEHWSQNDLDLQEELFLKGLNTRSST